MVTLSLEPWGSEEGGDGTPHPFRVTLKTPPPYRGGGDRLVKRVTLSLAPPYLDGGGSNFQSNKGPL